MPGRPERSHMKRREVMEIKRQFAPANCSITRMAGAVANKDKEEIMEFNTTFLTLPEEMLFKYFNIFKKALSGKRGKNLYDLEFREGTGARMFLKHVRDTKLKEEDDAYQILLEDIIDHYDNAGRFAVFMIHGVYDIPGKAKDGKELEDASEVYEYIMTCICPVTLSKPGLCLKQETNSLGTAERDWMIGMPNTAFLYPAFNDRSEDWDHIWFYTKKPNEPDREIVEGVLGCEMPVTPELQKAKMQYSIRECMEDAYEMDKVKRLFEKLQILAENQDESEEGISEEEIRKVLREVGLKIEGTAGEEDTGIILKNVINTKTFEIGTEEAHITVQAERTDLVDIREIEGETYVVVKANDEIYANGFAIRKEV